MNKTAQPKPEYCGSESLVWAIDPFEDEEYARPMQFREFIPWLCSVGIDVHPVHVVSIPPQEIALDDRITRDQVLRSVRKEMTSYLNVLKMPAQLPVHILVEPTSSRKGAVKRLIEFAEERKALCILTSTHGRSGLGRLVMGSFSENLLKNARCPVVILGHSADRPPLAVPPRRILFSTDFSENCRRAFEIFLIQARRFGIPVTIFHAVTLPSVAMSEFGLAATFPENYFEGQKEWAREEGAAWTELARTHGVDARFVVRESMVGAQVPELILKAVEEEGADMIVMASSTEGATAFVAGSVTRDVFRANRYPVWVYGPRALEEMQKVGDSYFARPASSISTAKKPGRSAFQA